MFLSGKGGVGKTTVAANVAISLAKLKKKVLIIDADWAMANLDILFGLRNTPHNLLDVIDGKDPNLAIYDGAFGVKILPAGFTLDWDCLLGEKILEVIEKSCKGFDYVLIDAPSGKDASSLFFKGFEFIIVTIPETSAISDGLKTKAVADSYGMEFSGVIVNRAIRSLGEVSQPEIESAFESEVLGWIPEEILMKHAVALEKPISSLFLNDKVTESFESIARRINDQSPSKIGIVIEELKKAKEKSKKSIENISSKILEEMPPSDINVEKEFMKDISLKILEPEEKTIYYSVFEVEKEFMKDISLKILEPEEKKEEKIPYSVFEIEKEIIEDTSSDMDKKEDVLKLMGIKEDLFETEPPDLKIPHEEGKSVSEDFSTIRQNNGLEFLDEMGGIDRGVDRVFVKEIVIDLKNLVELIDKYRNVIKRDYKISKEYEEVLKEREKKFKPCLPLKEFDLYAFQKWQTEIEKIEKLSLKDYKWYITLGISASLLIALIIFSMDPYLSALLFLVSITFLGSFLYLDLNRGISNRYRRLNQEILDYLIKMIKETNINPREFILILSHKDYRGLEYEKIDKDYRAIVVK